MNWTERDRTVWNNIQSWKETLSRSDHNMEDTYNRWIDHALSLIPNHLTLPFFEKMDTWLFHLHSLIQGLQIQNDARERILNSGRVFDETIHTLLDMRRLTIDQLSFIADQLTARHRLYSFFQGGLSGTGKPIFISTDFLMMVTLNLRSVQISAMSYGYDIQAPFELLTSLKVFHAATLPKRLRGNAWDELLLDLDDAQFFYEGSDNLLTIQWMEEPFKQLLKTFFISRFYKKDDSKLSLFPMAIGAGVNYQFSRKVTEFADHYYKYRYLLDKGEKR